MSYPPPGGQDPYQPLPPPEPESNPYAQPPASPPPASPPPASAPPAGTPYGQPYGQYPTPASPVTGGSNNLALASMITGIVSIVMACCCSPLGIVAGGTAAALGYVGMNQIKERGQTNRGMAIAGMATGAAGLVLSIVLLIVGLLFDTGSWMTNNYDFD